MSLPLTAPERPPGHAERALSLALALAHAENRLLALTSGQVDAIVDQEGRAYLLRPAQLELRRNEQRLQAVIDSAADVITVVNRGGEILSQSPAVRRMLGYGTEELVGRRFFDLIHELDLPRFYSAFFNVIEGFQKSASIQVRHRSRDGAYRLIETTVGKLFDGFSASVVFVSRPVTTLPLTTAQPEEREVAYVHAALAKDHFLAMLSHELRTPLTPALLGLGELEGDERFIEVRSTLAMIRRNLELQSRLLEELTEFTTVNEHKVRLRFESIDAHETIGFVLKICASEITTAKIKIVLNLRAADPMVLADSVRVQQVMWNLLNNAIKYSPEGSTIIIATAKDSPGRLAIEFVDQGVGIEPELLPLVFESLRQGDHPAPPKSALGSGLGLGLFIAKGLAEAQSGTLTAQSAGRGHGTTFRLTLANAPATPIAPAATANSPRHPLSRPAPG